MTMATRAPFLSNAYSAYYHRERPAEDEELSRVGPGTPGGEYLQTLLAAGRPVHELRDLPKQLRILGEDLVAFRDKSGAVGLLELHCPHRGTSLEFGLVGEKGIRCCYHGWLFDVDGTILETPGEPADSTLKDRLFHGAYPVHEYHGLVFAYMGPPDAPPDFPIFDTYELPGYQLAARQGAVWACNWLQVKDNSMDPAHLAFLHTLPGSQGFTDDLGAPANGTGWRRRSAWSISTRAATATGSGCASPISSCPTSTSSRRMPTRWRCERQSTGRRRRPGRCRSTTPTRCRSATAARPKAAKCAATAGSGKTVTGPMRNGSASPATTTRKSASMMAWPATDSNISPRPTAASS